MVRTVAATERRASLASASVWQAGTRGHPPPSTPTYLLDLHSRGPACQPLSLWGKQACLTSSMPSASRSASVPSPSTDRAAGQNESPVHT